MERRRLRCFWGRRERRLGRPAIDRDPHASARGEQALRAAAVPLAECEDEMVGVSALKPGAPASENKIQDDEREDEAECASAVVADARTHVVAAATEDEKKDNEDYDQHPR